MIKEKDFERIEKKYTEEGLLKLHKDCPVNAGLSLYDFLTELILTWNVSWDTYKANSRFGKRSLTDVKNLHRSVADIYKITKFYKPEVTFKDVISTLLEIRKEAKISSLYCSTIHKLTFFPRDSRHYLNRIYPNKNKVDISNNINMFDFCNYFDLPDKKLHDFF